MKKSTWVWILTAIIMIAMVVISYLVVKASSQNILITWDKYNLSESPDAATIKLWEVRKDTSGWIFSKELGKVPIQDTVFNYIYWNMEDRMYYYGATAIDTANNISELSNIDSLDFEKPTELKNIKVIKK